MTNKKNKLKKKLTHKYRLVISSEDNWEEKFSIRLNRLNVFIFTSLTALFLIAGTILLIAFTPLKEYIPGYDSTKLREQSQNLLFKTDSLEQVIIKNQKYIDNLALILSGDVDRDSIMKINTEKELSSDNSDIDFSTSKVDSIFRAEVEREDRYNVTSDENKHNFILTAPIKGNLTQIFDSENKHYAIDIATKEGTPIKAVAEGTVIFSEWTSATGNVIIIDHENNLISVYKHNSANTKEQGDFVEQGEVIAISGSTGELSSGPHLHFELWYNGYPVNPTNFIDFEL